VRSKNFDPLEYIESGFLDKQHEGEGPSDGLMTKSRVGVEDYSDYLKSPDGAPADYDPQPKRTRFRKTVMSAPRPRRAKNQGDDPVIDPELQQIWETLPKSIDFLCSFYDDSVTANYYRGSFKESRQDLIRRLLDPELTLEETSRLLGVCPATVRRYTNRGWLTHHRTNGGQRRFRLSDVVKFVEQHGRYPEE
jgi:excisionase family DNA binding protein